MDKNKYFEALYLEYAGRVVRLAYRYTGDEDAARDIMQETFLTALTHIDILIEHSNPAGWLYKTAWNLTQHALTKRNRERPEEFIPDTAAPEPDVPLDALLPKNMPREDVELLTLYYEKKLSISELSNRYGISKSACKMKLSRLRMKLKSILNNM